VRAGAGTGAPGQTFHLHTTSVAETSFQLYALEMGDLRKCRRQQTFNSSGPADLDYLLDAETSTVEFGDGQNGRVPPIGSTLIAIASSTLGAKGNVGAQSISVLDAGSHNTALIGDVSAIADKFESIRNPDPASGGSDAELLTHAEGRAVQILQQPSRAVTLADCEALALQTPGTQLARAMAIANHHPRFQCYAAPGFITLVIVPRLPAGRPVPSAGLLSAVSAYLKPRQVIGTRIVVTGPSYLEIAVSAQVKAYFGQNKTAVAKAVKTALEKFLDPLSGGPDGLGWPLGGDVYISEVFEAIAAVPGVDHVLKVELVSPGCGAQCGNVCLQPLALVVSGAHQITVT
jgi:predicted phage baseplate assembly protein